MEQSGGKVGITDVKTYGPYRMPKKLYQYGLNDIGQARQADRQRVPGGRRPSPAAATGAQTIDGRRLVVLLCR